MVEVDETKALAAKTVAAEAGYSLAGADVGNIHAQKGDWPQAVRWWTAAAAAWQARPTPLTLRAMSGYREVQELLR